METFARPKKLVPNPHYRDQRKKSLSGLSNGMIDRPIVELIHAINRLPHCFTLQCCYGHFLYKGQPDPDNLDPLPVSGVSALVEYRIAYIALCIENSPMGEQLLEELEKIPAIDPDNVQFCSAIWFWERQVNSYALQVEPDRFKHEDKAMIEYGEAKKIEKIRVVFFDAIRQLIQGQHDLLRSGQAC